jgi:hypothetical protein
MDNINTQIINCRTAKAEIDNDITAIHQSVINAVTRYASDLNYIIKSVSATNYSDEYVLVTALIEYTDD